MHRARARVWNIQVPSKDCRGASRLESCCGRRDAVYKCTSTDGYAGARRRESQPSERGCIKRHNRRLFKRMRPYGSGFAPPLYVRTHNSLNIPRAKRQNTESSFYRVPTPSLLASSFFPQPILLPLFLSPAVSFPSPRPNAAHNSRSQFSISADFSIRLRGAAVLTRETQPFLRGKFLLLPLPPLFLCTNTRMSYWRDDIANWKALGFLSPSPRLFLTSGQRNRVDVTPRLQKNDVLKEVVFGVEVFYKKEKMSFI